jgi:hypothetical protein
MRADKFDLSRTFAPRDALSRGQSTGARSREEAHTRPIVRRGTGLHADEARHQRFKELNQLAAAELLPDNDPFGRVDAVNLEYVRWRGGHSIFLNI